MSKLLIGPIVVILLLASCSGGPTTYADAQAVVVDLEKNDLGCLSVERQDGGQLPSDSLTCSLDGGDVGVYVFEDEDHRDRWLLVGERLGDVVVGPNWTIDAPDGETAAQIGSALRGETR